MKKMLILALATGMVSTANAKLTLVSSQGDTLDPTGVIAPNVTWIGIYNDDGGPSSGFLTFLTIPAGEPGRWMGSQHIYIPPALGGINTYYGVIDFGIGPVDLWVSDLAVASIPEDRSPGVWADYEFVCTGGGDVTITLWYDDLATVIDTITIHQVSGQTAARPSADITGDCFVDFDDFAMIGTDWPATDFNDVAVMANQWLTGDPNAPCVPYDMAWVYIDDPGVPGHEGFTGYLGKYEVTNAQYCKYLNEAKALGDIAIRWNRLDWVFGNGGIYDGLRYYGMRDSYAEIYY